MKIDPMKNPPMSKLRPISQIRSAASWYLKLLCDYWSGSEAQERRLQNLKANNLDRLSVMK